MRRTARATAVLAVAVAVLTAGCAADVGQAGGGAASGTSSSGAGESAGDGAAGTAGGSGGSGAGTTGDVPATTRTPPGRTPTAPSSPNTRPAATTPTTAAPPVTTAPRLTSAPQTTAGPAPTTTGAPAAPDSSRGRSGFGGSSGVGEPSSAGGSGGSGGSSGIDRSDDPSPTDDPVARGTVPSGGGGASGGSSQAFDDQPDRPTEPGTRPPPTPQELDAAERQTPSPGVVLFFDAITLLPGFVLVACLAGLLSYAALPPGQRYQAPFPDGTIARRVAEACAAYDVQPLQTRSVSSGGSSRAVQPDDVQLEVRVEDGVGTGVAGSKRIIVRERLREGVRTPEQGFLATLAMLLLFVVLTATGAAAWRTRSRR